MYKILIVVGSEIKVETVERTGVKKDGKTFSIEFSNSGWKTEKGQFCTYNIRDITDRKKTEKCCAAIQASWKGLYPCALRI